MKVIMIIQLVPVRLAPVLVVQNGSVCKRGADTLHLGERVRQLERELEKKIRKRFTKQFRKETFTPVSLKVLSLPRVLVMLTT